MTVVGIRELKNRLSEYLRRVQQGEVILVTDRGTVVAQVSPPGELRAPANLPPGLLEMARRGLATLGEPNDKKRYPLLPPCLRGVTAQQLLEQERGLR